MTSKNPILKAPVGVVNASEEEVIAVTTTIKIKIDERMGVDRSLKKFKRMCESFGVVREYRKRQEYKKPSVKMKEKLEAAEKRRRKSSFKYRRSKI